MPVAFAPPALAPLRPRWVPAPVPSEQQLSALVRELGLPPTVCALLVQRGYGDSVSARSFLKPARSQIHAPHLLTGMSDATTRLVLARERRERVMVHGDYDVDGICATALLVRALTMMGISAVPFVPDRLRHGYDLTSAGIAAARSAGATLIVTVDCGIVAHSAVLEARAAGIDVIVTDHHAPGGTLPDALAVINPNRPDCDYPDKGLAGVGVSFKLALALADALGFPEERLFPLLDLVALATIADLAPLTTENRAIVRWGLSILSRTPNPGLRALIRSCRLGDKNEIHAGQVGFIIAPRLNAAGRLGDAMRGVRLLLTDDAREAAAIADELELENSRRKQLDQDTLRSVVRVLERQFDPARDAGVVIASDSWHPGIIGIVASRVVELIHRPTMLIAVVDGEGKGSGRSIRGFHLQKALVRCAAHLKRFGGHGAAAGCSIDPARIGEFREAFSQTARAELEDDQLVPRLYLDGVISLRDAHSDLLRYLKHFAPFGISNATPTFAAFDVLVEGQPKLVGSEHLKLTLARDGARLEAIGFGMGARLPECAGSRIDVAFKLEENSWVGRDGAERTTVQARLVDFRPAA